MFTEKIGNVWDLADSNSAICILTNNSVLDGKNPMGGGIAYEALQRNEHLDEVVAKAIKYNVMFLARDIETNAVLLRFPTKHSIYDASSSLDLIKSSLHSLHLFAKSNPATTIYLPQPGCGIGGLDWIKDVRPLCVEILGDVSNVCIVSK